MCRQYSLLLLAVLAAIFLQQSVAKRDRSRCPWIDLENGRVRIRSRGRVAKFKCKKGFTRFEGDRFATCVRNEWNGKIPKCIRYGCVDLAAPEHGHREYQYRKALATFSCEPGYLLQGSRALSCNAINWNDTTPFCTAPASPEMSCDFESEDLCGWRNSLGDEFDWVRKRGPSTSFTAGTGPSADHTLGNNEGHYMYVDSSVPRPEGHRALLFSPVYPATPSTTLSCFSFFFHKYGTNSGTLNAYLKPEGVSMMFLPPILQMSSSNEARWLQHKFNITNTVHNYQIVLEVVQDDTNSDVGVDDVKLSHGDDCKDQTVPESGPTTTTQPTTTTTTTTTATTPATTPTTPTTTTTEASAIITITNVTTTQTDNITTNSAITTNATNTTISTDTTIPTDTTISTDTTTTHPINTDTITTSPTTTTITDITTTTSTITDITTRPSITATTTSIPTTATTLTTTTTHLPTPDQGTRKNVTHEEGDEDGEDLQSCRGRCGEIAMEEGACGCDIECGNESSCCSDLTTFCTNYLPTPVPVNTTTTLSTTLSTPMTTTSPTTPSVTSPSTPSEMTLTENVTAPDDGNDTSTTTAETATETTTTTVRTRPVTHPIGSSPLPLSPITLTFLQETTLERRTPKPTTTEEPALTTTSTTGTGDDKVLQTTQANQTTTTNVGELGTTKPSEPPAVTTTTSESTKTEATYITTLEPGDDTTTELRETLATRYVTEVKKTTVKTVATTTMASTARPIIHDTSDSWTLTARNSSSAPPPAATLPTTSQPPLGATKGMSKGTAVLISILVITGVILVAVAVALYIRRIRKQDKLADDSDILYLARDEVQMVDNISNLYGDRPRRGTPV